MKITIDTKDDSTEDIRKIVGFLSNLIDNREGRLTSSSRNIFESDSPSLSLYDAEPTVNDASSIGSYNEPPSESPTNAFASMFGSDSSEVQEPNGDHSTALDSGMREPVNEPSTPSILDEDGNELTSSPQKDWGDISEEEKQASRMVREY